MWQDWIIGIGNFVFFVALIPTIRAYEKPAVSTSAMTASVMTTFVICFVTLHLWLSFVAGALSASCWWILMVQVIIRNKPTKIWFEDTKEVK